MCVVVMAAGSILNIPICIIYGKRTIELENNITATRCSVLKRFDSSFLPIAHFGFLNVCSLIVVITIVVIQLKIRTVILRQSVFRKTDWAATYQRGKNLGYSAGLSYIIAGNEKGELKITASESNISTISRFFIVNNLKKRVEEEKNNRIVVTFCIITTFLLISFQACLWFQTLVSLDRYLHQEIQISISRDILYEYLPDVVTLNAVFNPFVYHYTDWGQGNVASMIYSIF